MNQPELSPLEKTIARKIDKTKDKASKPGYLRTLVAKLHLRNELFDFYFCVAQNIAAVELLGASGEKIVKAKIQLEESAQAYTNQVVDTSNWISEKLESQLDSIQQNQQKLDTKLIQVLEGLAREHQNLKTVSTGLVNSTSVLLKKQKQLVVQTEAVRRSAHQSVIIAWIIPVTTLLGFGLIHLFFLD